MDAYLGYNQTHMNGQNEKYTTFIIDQRLYCYNVMLFRLKMMKPHAKD